MRYAVPAGIGVVAFILGILVGLAGAEKEKAPLPPRQEKEVEKAAPTEAPPAAEKPAPDAKQCQRTGFALVPAKYDFGKMYEGEARKTIMGMQWPEGTSVKIGRLYSPCPCIQVSTTERAPASTDEAEVEVSLHSLTLEGKKSFPVYVELLEPPETVLRADVTLEAQRVPAKIMLKPRALHLGTVRGAKTATTKLLNLTSVPVRLGDMSCSLENVKVTVPEGKYIAAGTNVTIQIDVPEAGLPPGPIKGTVTVETTCPEHAHIAIPVDGTSLR